jgi:hypothetical protein
MRRLAPRHWGGEDWLAIILFERHPHSRAIRCSGIDRTSTNQPLSISPALMSSIIHRCEANLTILYIVASSGSLSVCERGGRGAIPVEGCSRCHIRTFNSNGVAVQLRSIQRSCVCHSCTCRQAQAQSYRANNFSHLNLPVVTVRRLHHHCCFASFLQRALGLRGTFPSRTLSFVPRSVSSRRLPPLHLSYLLL